MIQDINFALQLLFLISVRPKFKKKNPLLKHFFLYSDYLPYWVSDDSQADNMSYHSIRLNRSNKHFLVHVCVCMRAWCSDRCSFNYVTMV